MVWPRTSSRTFSLAMTKFWMTSTSSRLRPFESCHPCSWYASKLTWKNTWVSKKIERCEQGSNLRGKIPLDFKSNALTTRPSQLLRNNPSIDYFIDFSVERGSGADVVLYWYHRQFIEAAQERYLAENERAKIHQNIAEYFMGKWHGIAYCPCACTIYINQNI